MNQLQKIFSYEGSNLRAVTIEGDPWFVGKDICEYFGDTNYRRSLARLDEDEKGVSQVYTPGGVQSMTIVNEFGLYSLLFSMQPQKGNLPEPQYEERINQIKLFKRWITHEVIPSIRKTGSYQAKPETADEKLKRAEAMLMNAKTRQAKLMHELAREFKDQLSKESIQLLVAGATETLVGRPLLPNPEVPVLFSATDLAEELHISANMIGRVSNKHGIKTDQYGKWVLDKAKGHDKQVRTFLYNPEGRQKLIECLELEGKVVPLKKENTPD